MKRTISLKKSLNAICILATVLVVSVFTFSIFLAQRSSYEDGVEHSTAMYISELVAEANAFKEIQTINRWEVKFNETTYNRLKPKFNDKVYYKSGYPAIITRRGELLIHPADEGKNVSQLNYGARILSENKLRNTFEYQSIDDNKTKIVSYVFYEPYQVYLCVFIDKNDAYGMLYHYQTMLILIGFLFLIIVSFLIVRLNSFYVRIIEKITAATRRLLSGQLDEVVKHSSAVEMKDLADVFTKFHERNEVLTEYADKLSKGDLDQQIIVEFDDKRLPDYLMAIRDNIKSAREIETNRKIEDEKQNWVNKGLAKFSEILRTHTDDIQKHSDNILFNLVRYVNANQGVVFLLSDEFDGSNTSLELISAFAYDTKKYISKQIPLGEGLVGTCAIEKQTIYITDVPDDYIEITSGLGYATPRAVLVVPIKMEDTVLGVVEIASFNKFEKHQVEFIEKIMESVAATLSSARINARTADLLKKFEAQSRDMAKKEEEMRQNIEELKATQEELGNKEYEMLAYISAYLQELVVVEYNKAGHVTNLNTRFSTLTGQDRNHILNTTIKDHIQLKLAVIKDFSTVWDLLLQGQVVELTNSYTFKNESCTIHEKYIPLKSQNGKVSTILRVMNDVTILKRKDEQILAKAEEIDDIKKKNESTLKHRLEKEAQLQEELEQARGLINELEQKLKEKGNV